MRSSRKWTGTSGETIAESDAARLAAEFESDDAALSSADITLIGKVGRPSLAGSTGTSPQVTFRLSSTMRRRAEEIAHSRGMTVSALARQALEELVNQAR